MRSVHYLKSHNFFRSGLIDRKVAVSFSAGTVTSYFLKIHVWDTWEAWQANEALKLHSNLAPWFAEKAADSGNYKFRQIDGQVEGGTQMAKYNPNTQAPNIPAGCRIIMQKKQRCYLQVIRKKKPQRIGKTKLRCFYHIQHLMPCHVSSCQDKSQFVQFLFRCFWKNSSYLHCALCWMTPILTIIVAQ